MADYVMVGGFLGAGKTTVLPASAFSQRDNGCRAEYTRPQAPHAAPGGA